MTRLDKAANEANRLAKRMAAEKIKKEKSKPKMWNGKMIIPLAEWHKKQNFNTHEWRDYYPDKYIPGLLLETGDNEQIKGYQDEWWKGFSQYMESVKEPGYGKHKCGNCILNPVPFPEMTTIRDAMVKTQYNSNNKPLEFPCTVVNKFKCPYEDKRDQNYLAVLGLVWRILYYALKYNRKLTGNKRNTYTVDFEKKKIVHIFHLDDTTQSYDVEHFFSKLKFPKFEIVGHNDLYDAITTRDKLKSVLEEYFDGLSSGDEDNRQGLDVEYVKKEIDYFLDIFDKIKDVITLENLKNIDGDTLQYIKDYNEKHEKFWAEREKIMLSTDRKISKSEVRYGTCFSCGGFANIICQNCNIWTCLEHWRDHGIQVHNYAKHENSSSSIVQQ